MAYCLVRLAGLAENESGFMGKESLIALDIVTAVVCVIVLVLNCYLLAYHGFLISKGLTTYRHIRMKLNILNKKSKVI